MSPEEHIKGKLADYSGVMSYDDFNDLATSVAHQYDITLEEATALIHTHRGKVEIGSQEYHSQGFGPNNLWDGQDRAKNFGQHNPGDLAEPMSSRLPLSRRELVSNDKSFLNKLKKYLPEEVHAQYDQLVEKCPSGEVGTMLTWVLKNASSPLKELFWDATGYAMGDAVKQKVEEVKKKPTKTDDEEEFLSDAGDIKEPPLHKQAFKVGDKVRVVNNDQAPWGGEYKGIIERINAHNTFDIRDISTGVLNANQPAHLIRNPLGEGRQDVRVQQRRVGDPKGMGEGHSDSGDPNTKREMPGMYMMPRGQEGKDIKNPASNFYKEASEAKFKVGDTVSILHPENVPAIALILGKKSWDPSIGLRDEKTGERPGGWTLQPEDLSPEDRTGGVVRVYAVEGKPWYTVRIELMEPVSRISNSYRVEVSEDNLKVGDGETLHKKAGSFGHKVGDKIVVQKDQYSPDTWINCHCGKYMQEVKPGHPGQFYYKGIEGKAGTILALYRSNHEQSGFSFDCYTVLIDDVGTYHLNDMNLGHADPQVKIKVEEPSKEKLDGIKNKIRDAELAGNKELARQLMEQYMSLTATKKDPLYSVLFNKIVKERGAIAAANVVSYLEGKIASPSKSLTSVLHQYNIVAALNVEKALMEVKDKTVEQINTETAWNWGSRAAACYQLSSDATSEEEKDKWSSLGDDYRHESLEHAALVEDEGKLVGEVSRALAPFRKGNSHEGTVR